MYSQQTVSEANLNPAEAERPAAKRAAVDRRPMALGSVCLGLGFFLVFEMTPLDMVAVAVAVVFVALNRQRAVRNSFAVLVWARCSMF